MKRLRVPTKNLRRLFFQQYAQNIEMNRMKLGELTKLWRGLKPL